MKRGASYLFLITGLVLGALAGAAYAWLADPVSYTDMAPFSLNPAGKDAYRSLIAAAYTATGDLPRARARLELLRDGDPQQVLAAQAQRIIAGQGSYEEARGLALLAVALAPPATAAGPAYPAGTTPAAPVAVGTAAPQATETVSITPTPTFKPAAAPTVASSTVSDFIAAGSASICDSQHPALLQVRVVDTAGNPLPGVQVTVTWDSGEDRFYTGLKPEFGAGYADFQMEEGVNYSVSLPGMVEPVKGVSVSECPAEGGSPAYPAGWEVVFKEK